MMYKYTNLVLPPSTLRPYHLQELDANLLIVTRGHRTGIFAAPWSVVEDFVAGYSGAEFKGFPTRHLAQEWFSQRKSDYLRETKSSEAKIASTITTLQDPSYSGNEQITTRNFDLQRRPSHAKDEKRRQKQTTSPNGISVQHSSEKEIVGSCTVKQALYPTISGSRDFAQAYNSTSLLLENSVGVMDNRNPYPILPGFSRHARTFALVSPALPQMPQNKPPIVQSKYFAEDPCAGLNFGLFPAQAPLNKRDLPMHEPTFQSPYERGPSESEEESSTHTAERMVYNLESEDRTEQEENYDRALTPEPIFEKPSIPLTPEQARVLDRVAAGENVFFTGPAGSGKSLILAHIKYRLHRSSLKFAVTAPTGIAAVLIGGTTIHSFAGVGKGDRSVIYYVNRLQNRLDKQKKYKTQWEEIDVLIIDEISMLVPDLFCKLDAIAQKMRRNTNPFGGLQLILCGDFYQLPPVNLDTEKTCFACEYKIPPVLDRIYLDPQRHFLPPLPRANEAYFPDLVKDNNWASCAAPDCDYKYNDSIKYIFQTNPWAYLRLRSVLLTEVHRQTDPEWIGILDKVKHADLSQEVMTYLLNLRRRLQDLGGIKPTSLFTHRINVEQVNNESLESLPGIPTEFMALDSAYQIPKEHHDENMVDRSLPITGPVFQTYVLDFFNHLQTQRKLRLKFSAQVMLLANIDPRNNLVNGSRGVLKGFQQLSEESFLSGALKADRSNQKLLKHWFKCKAVNEKVTVPLVSFMPLANATTKPGQDGTHPEPVLRPPVPIFPVEWTHRYAYNETHDAWLQRIQIPLGLAWAATIHKSQGQTMDYVTVDISRAFAPGQVYVGLSRSRTPQGLQITSSRSLKEAIKTDPIVEEFNQLLQANHSHEDAKEDIKPEESMNVDIPYSGDEVFVKEDIKAEDAEDVPAVTKVIRPLQSKRLKRQHKLLQTTLMSTSLDKVKSEESQADDVQIVKVGMVEKVESQIHYCPFTLESDDEERSTIDLKGQEYNPIEIDD